jgi:hypothetical protein
MSVCGCVIPSPNCSCQSYMGFKMTEDVFPKGKLAALDPAQYWEAQASMWHDNYRKAMWHEEEARRYKIALERIRDSGYGTKERVRLIILKALGEKKDAS